MKNPLDVFEFKAEDELTEMAIKTIARTRAIDVSGTEIQPQENDSGLCGSADAATIDYNHYASGSFIPFATENFSEETPELSHAVHNEFKIHERAEEIKSDIIESRSVFCSVGCRSDPAGPMRENDHPNCALSESSYDDKSLHLASADNESLSERSQSDIANTSSDGPSSDNCFDGQNLGEERAQIVFYPDFVDYCSSHYLDVVVSFCRSYVEARSKTIYGDETFHIHLEIEDIFKIESQWCAKYEAGTVSIYFIPKDVAKDNIDSIHNASGLQELRFLTVDSNWYKKLEAIESLDVRYKALWSVLLDTGIEKCSASPEGDARMITRRYFPNFVQPFDEVIYPKGDPDAVSISKSDVDRLLPDTFVNDTIIDFYIKYLVTRQNMDERPKFHFFNSFFFRKLADMDRDPSSAFDGKAAFQRVRKWTRKVNLLEKDFIFIPINYSFHWSLIVICYFGEVACYEDDDGELGRVPCILHMDSMRGVHSEGLKDLIQSYLWEEWKERQKGTCEDLYSKFRNLKFISLELPQQQNTFDCGLFLLHFVELFLEEVPSNFNIYKITSSSKFLQADWFPPGEASMKRSHIERLVYGLLDTKSQNCLPSDRSGLHCSPQDLNTTHDYEEGVKFSVKCSPMSGCRGSSLGQVEHGIDMTLVPTSSIRDVQCNGTSGLVLKHLLKQGSALESLNNATWGLFESREPLCELKRPASPAQEEVEASECFATELAGHVFQHLDGVIPEAPVFPYSSEDCRLEPVHQPISDDIDSSPVASGCESGNLLEVEADEKGDCVEEVSLDGELLNAVGTQSLVETCEPNSGSIFLKNLLKIGEEANELQNDAVVSVEESGISKCEGPHQMLKSNDEGECISESANEGRLAKRMRITPADTSNLSDDELHL